MVPSQQRGEDGGLGEDGTCSKIQTKVRGEEGEKTYKEVGRKRGVGQCMEGRRERASPQPIAATHWSVAGFCIVSRTTKPYAFRKQNHNLEKDAQNH